MLGNMLLSLSALIILGATSEIVCGVLNRNLNTHAIKPSFGNLGVLDPDMCYCLAPNAFCHDIGRRDGVAVYECSIHTDSHGRRKTIVEHPENRTHFAAFVGCSFAFGQCLNDNETMASWLARLAPHYMPYNLGVFGYGPQQVLITLQRPLEKEIEQSKGICIYPFLMPHVNRAVGGMFMVNNWGRKFPHYEVRNGKLIRNGTFESEHPWRLKLFWLAGKSETLWFLKIGWPLTLRDKHLDLTARLVAESASVFKRKWPESEFYLLLWPMASMAKYHARLEPFLKKYSINYLYWPDALDSLPEELRTRDGGHPSSEANRLVMDRLVKELKLNEPDEQSQ